MKTIMVLVFLLMSFSISCFSSQFGVNSEQSDVITINNNFYLSELGYYFEKCEQSVEIMTAMFSDDSVSYSVVAKVISPQTIKKIFNKKYFDELKRKVALEYGRMRSVKLVIFQQIKGSFYAGYRCECKNNVYLTFIFDENGKIRAWHFNDTND